MDASEKRILINTCFGHFMSHFNMLVFPAVVIPLTASMNLTMAEVLGISFWMYLLFGLTALPWGLAADRWGAKPLLLLFYLGACLAGLGAALQIDSSAGFGIALAAIGFFSGIYHPAGLGLISKEMKRVSVGMGYNGIFGNLGLTTAPLLTGFVNWLWGPRSAYLVLGALNFLGLLLLLSLPISKSGQIKTAVSTEENGLLGAFLILLIAMMLGGIVYRGATVILPAYFELKNQEIFHWLSSIIGGSLSKNLVATSFTSVIYLVGMIGQYTGGRIGERYAPKMGYLIFHAVTVPVAFLMAMAGNISLIVLAVFYFFFLLGMQPIENTLVADFTPKRFHHSAYGTKFVLTFGVGAVAVKMAAAIETTVGIQAVFPALGMTSLILVGVIVFLIFKTSRKL
ncbi:MAG: MFS transporter [Deltaproteobacteria bacterium]|nr:MAG: MFS transporter [Deltaproteobacteria bacterium]